MVKVMNLDLVVKKFDELSLDELYEILQLRSKVFVVEQECIYQDVDGRDRNAYHVFLRDAKGVQAYLRVMEQGVAFENVSIGRVIAAKRRCGLGTQILRAGILVARERLGAQKIVLEAQVYARGLYEKQGFKQTTEEFLEDGIPHIGMELVF